MEGKRLQFVVGKGGVGKSTVTAALAIAAARAGDRVLAVELGGAAGLARLFGVAPASAGEPVEARPRLSVAYIEGEAALAEYLELVVPIRRLLATVLASRVYRYFVAAAPGLKELMTIGKVWYEHEKVGPDGAPVWDRIIVDAGASGHSLQYLHMPTTVAETFGSGLVHREARRVEALLTDASLTEVHVVALPEDMALTETAEIVERLTGELALPLGRILVNRCRERSPGGASEAVDLLRGTSLRGRVSSDGAEPDLELLREGVVVAAARALAWEQLQERGIERLERRIHTAVQRLPLLASEEFGLGEVEYLGSVIAELDGPRAEARP